jgi:hypothetical protein
MSFHPPIPRPRPATAVKPAAKRRPGPALSAKTTPQAPAKACK